MTTRIVQNMRMSIAVGGSILLTACGGGGGSSTPAPDPSGSTQTVTLTPSQDVTLYESATGALASGAGDQMITGRTNQMDDAIRRALVQFDVAGAVPTGATITEATLTLSITRTRAAAASQATLQRVLSSWGEGASHAGNRSGDGAAAEAGDATWVHRSFDTQTWGTAGGVFDATASATFSLGTQVGPATVNSSTGVVADVQRWLDTPAENFGWVILTDESTARSTRRFATRENGDAALRPSLVISYTTP